MYINNGKKYPTSKKYDMKASGKMESGIIKTINSNSQYYCKKKCQYKVRIVVNSIN